MSKIKPDWTRIEGKILACVRCGGTHELVLPMDAEAFLRVTKGFMALHSDCK